MAFEELKQRQAVMWGTGPYQNVTETLADIHEPRGRAARLRSRESAGSTSRAAPGAVAERAAAPARRHRARPRARPDRDRAGARPTEQGSTIDYRVGDCERLELEDAAFDIVSSTLRGHVRARTTRRAARELARVVPARRAARAHELDARRADSPRCYAASARRRRPATTTWGDEATSGSCSARLRAGDRASSVWTARGRVAGGLWDFLVALRRRRRRSSPRSTRSGATDTARRWLDYWRDFARRRRYRATPRLPARAGTRRR